jgi:DNA-binding transcriptional ArsR family regulator
VTLLRCQLCPHPSHVTTTSAVGISVSPTHTPGHSDFDILLYSNTIMSVITPPAIGELQAFKARFFKALAHPVRIRIVELLVASHRSVQELQAALALDQSSVSQHLAVLRANQVVTARKEGATVRYALRDPLVGDLLEVARRIFGNQLAGTQGMLRELRRERRRR